MKNLFNFHRILHISSSKIGQWDLKSLPEDCKIQYNKPENVGKN